MNYRVPKGVGCVGMIMASTTRPVLGIDHVTVVPTNWEEREQTRDENDSEE